MRDVKKRISKNVSIATSKITIAFETVETFYNNMLNGKTLTIVVDLWKVISRWVFKLEIIAGWKVYQIWATLHAVINI